MCRERYSRVVDIHEVGLPSEHCAYALFDPVTCVELTVKNDIVASFAPAVLLESHGKPRLGLRRQPKGVRNAKRRGGTG